MRARLILVVDDDEMIEEMIESHLEDLGCAHASFHDPLAAMDFFAENYTHIDLAIIDLAIVPSPCRREGSGQAPV